MPLFVKLATNVRLSFDLQPKTLVALGNLVVINLNAFLISKLLHMPASNV